MDLRRYRMLLTFGISLFAVACSQSTSPAPTWPTEIAATSSQAASSVEAPPPTSAGNSLVSAAASDRLIELRGQIARLTGTCPRVELVVHEAIVITDSSTEFRGSCDDLALRVWVHVKGVRQGNGTILAVYVGVGHDKTDKIELGGVVSGLRGTCPDINFSLREVTVFANRSTQYRVGACADVANGVRVDVKGLHHGDGSVLAAVIAVKRETGSTR